MLFESCGFEGERNLLACGAETIESHVCLRPVCAATRCGFDHLQARFGFGSALRAFRPDLLKPLAVCAKFVTQRGRIRALNVVRAVETAFDEKQLAFGVGDDARGRDARGERLSIGVRQHRVARVNLFERLTFGWR